MKDKLYDHMSKHHRLGCQYRLRLLQLLGETAYVGEPYNKQIVLEQYESMYHRKGMS